MLAEKVSQNHVRKLTDQSRAEQAMAAPAVPVQKEEKKEGVVAKRKADQQACKLASNFYL
jgi:hypothetical protein